jgi:glycosyltransferase involved in cell wall biosynthesis
LQLKRVLLLSRGGDIGGSQRQLLHLVENLDRSRYEPIVVCRTGGPFVEQLRRCCPRTHILTLRPWRKFPQRLLGFFDARRLTRMTRKEHVDLLHCSDLWMSGYLLFAASRLGLPSILHVRAPLPADDLRKHRCQQADGLIAISNRVKHHLLAAGVEERRISVIFDGVNLAEFTPGRAEPNVLHRDFPQARGTLIGLVGQIKAPKRQLEFLQMARRLVQSGEKDATFFVIGDPYEDSYHRRVRRYAAESGLGSRVVFVEHRDDMPDVLAALDVLVSLSGGSVMIEAMACGTPVVSAGFTPPGESTIVRHGQTGLLVQDGELDAAVARLIDDPALRTQLGQAGRQHAESHYSHIAMAEHTQQVYDRLLNR